MAKRAAKSLETHDQPPVFKVSDAAWAMLWDVDAADADADGCAEHHDPACLCDVDISRTAHIEWNQAPAELVAVETVDDLLGTAAAMLIRLDLEMRRATTRRLIRKGPHTYDVSAAALERCLDDPRGYEMVHYILANPTVGARTVARRFELGDHGDVNYLRKILGCKVAPPCNGGVARANRDRIIEWYVNQGWSVGEIVEQLVSEGLKATYDSVYTMLRRAGLIRRQAA